MSKIQRFILNIPALSSYPKNDLVIDSKEVVNQIKNVLRLKSGASIIISDGYGFEADATIDKVSKYSLQVSLSLPRPSLDLSLRPVHLYLSLLKKDNFELAIQKAVETGVSQIIPILTERTVKLNLNQNRLTKIIKEAAEQSGRGVLPILAPITSLNMALNSALGLKLFFSLSTPRSFSMVQASAQTPFSIFIGPEGGWSKAEEVLAQKHQATLLSFGPLILRSETAAIIATYLSVNL